MHAVRAAADRYGLDGQEQAEVPAVDVLAALTRLDEARAALDTWSVTSPGPPAGAGPPGSRSPTISGWPPHERCRANEAPLRSAMWSLACFNDEWPQLARVACAEALAFWHRELAPVLSLTQGAR